MGGRIGKIEEVNNLFRGEVVFVGGVAEYLHGIKDDFNDIDFVINNPEIVTSKYSYDFFKTFGEDRINVPSKKWDIWVTPFPKYEIIKGFKIVTINQIIERYEYLFSLTKNNKYFNKISNVKFKYNKFKDCTP